MSSINRAIRRFVSKLRGKNKVIFFLVLLLICIIAVCLGIYGQFFYKYSETDPLMLGIHIGSKKTSADYANLKSNFSNLFTNELHVNSENVRVEKIETSQPLVYTGYSIQNEDESYYNVDIQLPVLNIDTEISQKINVEINEKFYNKATSIMRSGDDYTIYQVSYVAYVNQDAVSIAIKETSKYGNKPETVNIVTYNYSIPDEKEIDLEDLIELKEADKDDVQKNINDTIKTAYDNAHEISEQYGSTFERNPEDEMYKIEKTKSYFLTDDGYVYIVYTYGEKADTNEIDIVVF